MRLTAGGSTASTDDAKQLRGLDVSLWNKYKKQYEFAGNKDFFISLCMYVYTSTILKTKTPYPSSVKDLNPEVDKLLLSQLTSLCADRLSRYRRFMGGITYDGWGLEIEVNYYPFRSNHGDFGLHKDDYFRDGAAEYVEENIADARTALKPWLKRLREGGPGTMPVSAAAANFVTATRRLPRRAA